jgi:hypothetical protein
VRHQDEIVGDGRGRGQQIHPVDSDPHALRGGPKAAEFHGAVGVEIDDADLAIQEVGERRMDRIVRRASGRLDVGLRQADARSVQAAGVLDEAIRSGASAFTA